VQREGCGVMALCTFLQGQWLRWEQHAASRGGYPIRGVYLTLGQCQGSLLIQMVRGKGPSHWGVYGFH